MDFRKALSSDSTRKMIEAIATAIGNNIDYFEEVLNIAYTSKGMQSSRAARVIDLFIENKPEWGDNYANNISQNIINLNDHRTKRSLCRILTRHLPQDSDILGHLINFLFFEISSKEAPVALKVYATQTLYNLTTTIPEIVPELSAILETESPKNSKAFKSNAKKILMNLKKNCNLFILIVNCSFIFST